MTDPMTEDPWAETPPEETPPEETRTPPAEETPPEQGQGIADALNTPPAEPAETETPPEETPPPPPTQTLEQVLEAKRGANGLIFDRYKTPQDVIDAIPELDRQRGQLASRVGELEATRSTPADWQPSQDDPPLMRAACEAARLPPSQMAYSQQAVDAVAALLGWSQETIEKATPEDWRDARSDIRAMVGEARKDARQKAVEAQETQRAQEERQRVEREAVEQQTYQTFATRHPDLANPDLRTIVDAVSDDAAARGLIRPGMTMEQALDVVASETRRRMGIAPGAAVPTLTPPAPRTAAPPPPMVRPISGGGAGGGGKGGAAFVDDGSDFFNA